MKGISIFTGVLIIMFLSGCGTFTKMRYSRGFKSNIEFNFHKKQGEPEKRNVAAKAKKRQNSPALIPPPETTVSEVEIPANTPTLLIKKEKKDFTISRKKAQIQETLSFVKSSKNLQKASNEPKPLEPNIKLAGVFFLIYVVITAIATFILIGLLFGLFTIDPLLGIALLIVGGLAVSVLSIFSFVLAIIGLRNMKRSRGEYRGAVLALFIIVWFLLPLISTLISLIP